MTKITPLGSILVYELVVAIIKSKVCSSGCLCMNSGQVIYVCKLCPLHGASIKSGSNTKSSITGGVQMNRMEHQPALPCGRERARTTTTWPGGSICCSVPSTVQCWSVLCPDCKQTDSLTVSLYSPPRQAIWWQLGLHNELLVTFKHGWNSKSSIYPVMYCSIPRIHCAYALGKAITRAVIQGHFEAMSAHIDVPAATSSPFH